MIRIDELYNHTFWSWLERHRPGTRLFFCDPFGRSDPDSIFNYGRDDWTEYYYILLFDQEPIDLARHKPTFDRVVQLNKDIPGRRFGPGVIITSEKDSDTVEQICREYGWSSRYYFFHGWAALDWYRGYDRTFLMPEPHQRHITKTFIAPNRIVAGDRQHRLSMLYHIFKLGMTNNWISCPAVCPAEQVSVIDAVKPMSTIYPDIEQVFAGQQFPMEFPGETGAPMHSCWLSLFEECADSLLYLVTETVATGRRQHLTEKTFKPICLRMPFVLVGTQGSLKYLRSYGFKTFGDIWDESYDEEPNDLVRIQKIANLLKSLDTMSPHEKTDLFHRAQDICQHNFDHFYKGAFEQILWNELTSMLDDMPV